MPDAFARGVFLDKDGTLNADLGYEKNLKRIEFLPNAIAGIQKIKNLGYLPIIISNQSGIGRGLYSEAEFQTHLRKYLHSLDEIHASVAAAYFCPHHPTMGQGKYHKECDCRKPRTGLLLRAQAHFALDLKQSVCIGDKLSDIELARRAGCRAILVKTGCGKKTFLKLKGKKAAVKPDFYADDLLDAALFLESTAVV